MPPYKHISLLSGPNNIRLLRLFPSENNHAPIECTLFNYTLADTRRGCHLYEALSYSWGSTTKAKSIIIDGLEQPVTANLYAAMLHLRDTYLARVIWIDALCIDQTNIEERGQQVQLMARVYGMASRVIVWLGDTADDSDHALDAIRIAAISGATDSAEDNATRQAITAARQTLITCGQIEIEGHAFCMGLNILERRYRLHSTVESVIYLMKEAIFRLPMNRSSQRQGTLEIAPLGELIDIYHSHEATERHDKIFALLGMSSDDPIRAGLLPNYRVSWQDLLQQLVKFLLHRDVSVQTWPQIEGAIIKGKGYISGRVSSVKRSDHDSGQQVTLTLGSANVNSDNQRQWITNASAKSVRVGDLVCFIYKALKPCIIRPHGDYFSVVRLVVPLEIEKPDTTVLGDLLLVWNWLDDQNTTREMDEYANRRKALVPQCATSEVGDYSDRAARLWNMAMVFRNWAENLQAETRLRAALAAYTKGVGEAHPDTFRCIRELVLMCRRLDRLGDITTLLEQEVQIKVRIQGMSPDTLKSISDLAAAYGEQGNADEEHRWMSMLIALELNDRDPLDDQEVINIFQSPNKNLVLLLLNQFKDRIPITESILEVVMENEGL
ncbi:hypothetical protein FE257_003701 [Aspergillus nanangensis]|uniref:Heterokaryon incompatibility domain-containing protein n=1 Tax=Aspergillus nanangensis TaxID=2582783 RepID=A0AAD4GVG4_ASPNN|nr:hypothetical protein FE257_003701 [Aspergillus nanangensis]